jgi:hypothetical protein
MDAYALVPYFDARALLTCDVQVLCVSSAHTDWFPDWHTTRDALECHHLCVLAM